MKLYDTLTYPLALTTDETEVMIHKGIKFRYAHNTIKDEEWKQNPWNTIDNEIYKYYYEASSREPVRIFIDSTENKIIMNSTKQNN